MLATILGPPPENKIEHEHGRRWRGVDRLRKILWVELRTNDRKALQPEDIGPNERMSAMFRPKILDRQEMYGGRVGRDIVVRPALPAHQSPLMTWDALFQPIQAWEAWQVAEAEGMALQGIEYNHPDGVYMLHLEDIEDLASMRLQLKPKGMDLEHLEDLTDQLMAYSKDVERGSEHWIEDLVDGNKYIEDYDTALRLLTVDERFIDHQLPNLGWRVANVWKMDHKNVLVQANEFGLKKGQWLLERLARRKEAVARKKDV